MIYLYESTETDFRYNGKPLPTAYDVTVSNTLNGEYYVMGKYPLDKDKVYKEIVEDRIIKVHTMDGMEPFRIVSVNKHELYVEFEAWPLFYADMRNKLVKPLNLKGASGQTALNYFKNNLLIDTPFDFYSDITDNHDYHTQDENERENNPKQLYNALDVFKTIVSRWGGELWIRGYDVRVNKRIGTDTESMLYEKKNITEFVDTTNIEGIVTRLHGKSEWQDERQEGEEEGQKHSIEVTVDSPLINDYSGVVFEKQFTNNDIRTEQELKNWLNLKFTTENIDKPQRTIEVGTNVIDETEIGFADTLILKYIKHDTDVRIKVVGYEYDGFANKVIRIILGETKLSATSAIGNSIVDLTNDAIGQVDRKATIAMTSANGKNTNYHGEQMPMGSQLQKGDLWYKPIGDETEMYIYNGTIWELIVSTAVNNEIDRRIKDAKEIAEDSALRANEAYGRVQKAIDDAEEAYDYADSALKSANGKNTVYRGSSKPTDGGKGDIWFKETADGFITHVHNGTDFEESSLDGKSIAGVINFGDVTALNFDANSITTGDIQIDRGLKVVNNGQDVLKAENGNVTMDVDNLLIKSKGIDHLIGTAIYQDNKSIGLLYEENGVTKSLISLGAEGPYLTGKNIVLDGNTIVNGSFTVTDEVFAENMNISKFTAGTLNAADVNIINLNVDKLVGNKTTFVQSAWNAINSRADMNGTRLRFTHTDGSSTEIGASGIRRVTPNDNRNYHYLISIHTFVYGESSSSARWVQLPNDFKGKDFKVYMALADSMSVENYQRVLQRMVATRHPDHNIDYTNARVPVIAYKSESLGDGKAPNITNVQGMLIAIF